MATRPSYALEDRYLAEHGSVFVTGIQALARLPLEQLRVDRAAGLHTAALVTGYPGSPLGGYDSAVTQAAALAPDVEVVFRQALNEELAATAVMGAQLASLQADRRHDGVVGIWYGKAPGVERAADALRHAVFAGTAAHGGALALVGDDPAAKSSTVPSSSVGLLADMHMPVFYPGDPGEALDLGRHGIALSRTSGLWCALKVVADVADATATIELAPERIVPIIPTLDGVPYRHQPDGRLLTPHTLELEQEIVEVRYELATSYASLNKLNTATVDPDDAWIGIVSSGVTYREVREALARLGLPTDRDVAGAGIRLLKMAMPTPFDPSTVRHFSRGLQEVLVVEEKRATLESQIKDALYAATSRPSVAGKYDEFGHRLVPEHGALDADAIAPILRGRLERRLGDRLAPPPPPQRELIALTVQRSPYYCSGCPHNRSTKAPEGALIGAGIGCHTMALLMDPEQFGDIAGITCMGSEGAQWVGMAPFVERGHFIQNVGDGTYFHSAQLAVLNSIAAGVNITYKLLYNSTVAMTGGQDPQGQLEVADLALVLLTQGVARVLVTTEDLGRYDHVTLPDGVDLWSRDRLVEAQELLASTEGVTVLIHDQRCAAEVRRDRHRGVVAQPAQRVIINHRICEGCGDCGRVSNCLSVQPVDTPFGQKTEIDQTTCNFDYSCLEGDCPSFMTVTTDEPGPIRRALRKGPWTRADGPPDGEPDSAGVVAGAPTRFPEPELVVPDDDFAVRITGIGGTGVVTVAQVLGTAAMLDGYHVRGLDQIGLSQKAGPVVSDVRISRHTASPTNRLGAGQADLLLALDQLVAASPTGMLTAQPDRTTVVGSLHPTPTGEMVSHLDVDLPPASELCSRIASVTRPDHQYWADAHAATTALFGNATTANMFVVGMAVQAGCMPIGASSVEEAIRLNGVAVHANVEAFRWGRLQVSDPTAMAVSAGSGASPDRPAPRKLPAGLDKRIVAIADPGDVERFRMFAAELIAWGSGATARTWLDVLERVSAAERKVAPESRALIAAVAAGLFKLTAYKDEYEVARLMTDSEGTAPARALAGDGATVAWKLHPPMMRALGMDDKISIGTWAEPAIKALAKGKRLRGTIADPFGRTAVRRTERELAQEYIDAVDGILGALNVANLPAAVELAELADMVRGYEDIKLANVERYRARLAELMALFS